VGGLGKMIVKAVRHLASALVVFFVSAVAALAQEGVVVAMTKPAQLTSAGATVALKQGDTVAMGDVVSTGDKGQVQIVFPDKTRVVVGPNSQLTIEKLLFRNNDTARKMTLSAAAGTFRFLTGDSPKRAYSVRTPTATMAVRGTAFDFAVDKSAKDTALVVHEGTVRYCDGRGRCVSVPNGCQMVMLDRLRRFTQPENLEQRLTILRAMFPYARNDKQLEPLFRTYVAECRKGDGESAKMASNTAVTQLELPPDPSGKTTIEHKQDTAPEHPAE